MKLRTEMVATAIVACLVFVSVPRLLAHGPGGGGGGGGSFHGGGGFGGMKVGAGFGGGFGAGTIRPTATFHQPTSPSIQPIHQHASGYNWHHSDGFSHNPYYHNYYHHRGAYWYDPLVGYAPVPVVQPIEVYNPPVTTSVNLPINSDQLQGDAGMDAPQTAPVNTTSSLPKPKRTQPNPTRPVKPASLAKNKRPGASQLTPYSQKLAMNAADTIQTDAMDTLESLEKQLPNDANVHDAIEAAKAAVAEGKPLPKNWMANLVASVKAAGGPINKGEANKLAKLVPGLLAANNLLSNAIALGFNQAKFGGLPMGPATVIVFPSLPANTLVLLPTGSLIAGTGGQGCTQVVTAEAATLLDLPLGAGSPIANASTDVSKPMTKGILLRNPAENSNTVNYVVDSQPSSSLDPDYTQEINDGNTHTVRFSRGPSAGEASYQLTSGTYAFVATDTGWDLQQESFSVTVDNSQGADDFNFVADNHQKKVTAGNTQVINSNYPIVVRFNRGDAGVDGTKCITTQDAQLVVAVNPTDGLWDLFPADSNSDTANVAGGSSDTTTSPDSRMLSVLANAGAKL